MKVSGIEVDLTREEMAQVKKIVGREPNAVEIAMIDIMWSEHCSYKTSRPILKRLPTEGKHVVLGPGFDAGVVDVGDDWCAAFKIESHNHPSAIEPYSGAATGVGGIIRDVLAVGAKPVAVLDSLFFGRLASERSQWLLNYVVKGIADYGNCVGIPTVAGETNFDASFESNCLVNAACVGLVRKGKVIMGRAKDAGDQIVLVGSKTGKDGIHGVTFASKNLSEKSEEERPAVQIPDPFTKKLIIDAQEELLELGILKGVKDFGGGGLTCCSSEFAFKGGKGAEIDVAAVPLREKLSALEIMLSESQERMLYACAPKDLKQLQAVFDKYGLTHALIGKIIEEKRYIVKENGKVVADLPIEVLTEVPTVDAPAKKPADLEKLHAEKRPAQPENLNHAFLQLLRSENVASKRWVFQQYDHEVGLRTILKPGDAGAGLIRINDKRALAVKSDCAYRVAALDPYAGGAESVMECARNITAVGAKPWAMVDNLNFGNPRKPEVVWEFTQAVKGMSEACEVLQVPCVGGNVSFYNEDDALKKEVKPSPTVMLVGVLDDVAKMMTPHFKSAEEAVVLLGETHPEIAASEYAQAVLAWEGGKPPTVPLEEQKKAMELVAEANRAHLLASCNDLSTGGLAVAASEMCLKANLGLQIFLERVPAKRKLLQDEALFAETPGRFLVSTHEPQKLLKLASERGVKGEIIGRTVAEKRFVAFDAESTRKRVLDIAVTSLRDETERVLPEKMK